MINSSTGDAKLIYVDIQKKKLQRFIPIKNTPYKIRDERQYTVCLTPATFWLPTTSVFSPQLENHLVSSMTK